jgi:hypothetical protein
MSKSINSFDRSTVVLIANDIQSALAKVANQYGVNIKVGNASFSPTNFTTKITVSTISKDGTVMGKEASDFDRYAFMFGITDYKVGDEFEFRDETYKIVGMLPRSKKYPVLAKSVSSGKTFKFPASVLGGHKYR